MLPDAGPIKKATSWGETKNWQPESRPSTHSEVAFLLRDLRKKKGIRRTTEAAEQAEIPPSALHKMEKGIPLPVKRRVQYAHYIAALAKLYEVRPEDILTKPVQEED